ncbi:hypothetical protein D9757_007935 [Collybiopsis confluens]|uniref:Protein kinase domain-containing protein n=1 Tax=Collybiopsis confluens TaxID=2823264 RepID=A0A8H5M487_9AGAR|nr:hypothetical protein D9757_007935 [Collybiopsis confluens]
MDYLPLPTITSPLSLEVEILSKNSGLLFWNPVQDNTEYLSDFEVNATYNQGMRVYGYTGFTVNALSDVYNSGTMVRISYDRNEEFSQCPENKTLDSSRGHTLPIKDIEKVLAFIAEKPGWDAFFGPIQVAYKTVSIDGAPQIIHRPAVDPSLDRFPDIPQLSLPSIQLRSLRRKFRNSVAMNIDVVVLEGDVNSKLHVLKRAPRLIDSESFAGELLFMAGSIPESPLLIRPTMMVLDDDSKSLRGYLLPYHPASSLWSVFWSRHREKVTLSSASCTPRSTENPHDPISWTLKLIWAIDIAAGLAFLHHQEIYWGDLKLDNIILCEDGHCRFIDYDPSGYSPEWCPPEMEKVEYPDSQPEDWDKFIQQARTPERDMFSLGLVLWAIAEEVGSLKREPDFSTPELSWTLRTDTPEWFRELASSCVLEEPHRRPTSLMVYRSLISQLCMTYEPASGLRQ